MKEDTVHHRKSQQLDYKSILIKRQLNNEIKKKKKKSFSFKGKRSLIKGGREGRRRERKEGKGRRERFP